MASCLVQQLFRQKVGLELDPVIIEEVMFPLLRPRKHAPKELLLDIRVVGIMIAGKSLQRDRTRPIYWGRFRASQQAVNAVSNQLWPRVPIWPWQAPLPDPPPGKKHRRNKLHMCCMGTIDIINDMRSLNYPDIGHGENRWVGNEHLVKYFDRAYIRLEDVSFSPVTLPTWVDHNHYNSVLIENRIRFVNNFLEDALVRGNQLTLDGGRVGRIGMKSLRG
jgi:hypothetical protein